MPNLRHVILAGGAAHRVESPSPRALLQVHGVPILGYALDLARTFEPRSITVVAKDGCAAIKSWVGEQAAIVEQKEDLGSGHALALALESLPSDTDEVLVTYADRIFLKKRSLQGLLETGREGAVAGLLSYRTERPHGYARVVRDSDGKVLRASGDCKLVRPEDGDIREVVAGAYWFRRDALRKALPRAAAMTYKTNLTVCVASLVSNGGLVVALPLEDAREARGTYSSEDARLAESEIRPPADTFSLVDARVSA
jgi:bifunctional UDP-N-acetylglucosamine pyrophosphorylase/glucosamine-1-phosphate N-acetyltransferase